MYLMYLSLIMLLNWIGNSSNIQEMYNVHSRYIILSISRINSSNISISCQTSLQRCSTIHIEQQGLLDSVGNISYTNDSSSVTFRWVQPSSLDIYGEENRYIQKFYLKKK